MARNRCKLQWPLTIAAVLSLSVVSLQAAPVTATCSPTKMRVMVSTTLDHNYTDTFKTLPESVVSFTQGGSSASCVLVRFSAEAAAQNPEQLPVAGNVRVRATIDNTITATPAEVYFRANMEITDHSDARSYEFLFPDVEPGAHVVRIQFRAGLGNAFIGRRTTIVQHAP